MKKDDRALLSNFLAFLMGGGTGLIAFLFFQFNWLFSLLFGLLGYSLTMLIVFPGNKDRLKKGRFYTPATQAAKQTAE